MFHISICFWQALYMGGRVGSLRSRVSVTFDAKGEAHCQFSSFQWFLGCFCGPNMDQLDQFWCRYDGMLFLFLLFVGEGFGEYFLVTVYIYIYTFLMGEFLALLIGNSQGNVLFFGKREYPIALVEPASSRHYWPYNLQKLQSKLFSRPFC